MIPPVVETDRLLLRPLRLGDFEAEAAFFASPRSAFVGGPQSRAESWRSFAAYAGHWSLRGYGPFAVEEKATGLYCGRTGPYFPEGWPEPELAWTLMDHAEGRGIAAEAARAARLWAYRSLGWTTAVSVIARGNVRSAALAERLGARREADFPHPDLGPMWIYRHPGPGAQEAA